MSNEETLISEIQKLNFEELRILFNNIFLVFISFLNSISDEEDKLLQVNMEDFLKEMTELTQNFEAKPPEEQEETIIKLLALYREKLYLSLSEDNKKSLEKRIKSTIEETLLLINASVA